MDFTIKSRYGQVVLNKPVFFRLSYTNGLSSVSRRPHLQTWISLKPVGQSWSNLCVASLGWGKGCIRFWGRLDQNSGYYYLLFFSWLCLAPQWSDFWIRHWFCPGIFLRTFSMFILYWKSKKKTFLKEFVLGSGNFSSKMTIQLG